MTRGGGLAQKSRCPHPHLGGGGSRNFAKMRTHVDGQGRGLYVDVINVCSLFETDISRIRLCVVTAFQSNVILV